MSEEMNIQLLGDFILINAPQQGEQKRENLYVVSLTDEVSNVGQVAFVGPGISVDGEMAVNMVVNPGDTVIYGEDFITVSYNQQSFYAMRQNNIIGIINSQQE